MTTDTVVAVFSHVALVGSDIAAVERELEQELTNAHIYSVSVYGVEPVAETPHAAVLRDQLSMLKEELAYCDSLLVQPL